MCSDFLVFSLHVFVFTTGFLFGIIVGYCSKRADYNSL